jgi:hypothetical protein
VEAFFDAWSSSINTEHDDEDGDVDMDDIEQELKIVKDHVNKRPDIEKNPWLDSIIKSF